MNQLFRLMPLIFLCLSCMQEPKADIDFVKSFYTKLLDFDAEKQGFENRPKITLSVSLLSVIEENKSMCGKYGDGPCGLGGIHDLYTDNFEADESMNSENSGLRVEKTADGSILVQFNAFPNDAKSTTSFDTKVKIRVIKENGNFVVDDFSYRDGASIRVLIQQENDELRSSAGK